MTLCFMILNYSVTGDEQQISCQKLEKAGIILNTKKFLFCQKSVDFIGSRISNELIESLIKYLDSIRKFPTPKSATDTRNWFGLVNQVLNYVKLRKVMEPFRDFLSPKHKFMWTENLNQSFIESKKLIIDAIRSDVQIFDLGKLTCLRPDWSKQGLGYFLMQKHCNCNSRLPDCCTTGWKVTLAGSRFLNGAETNYAAIEGQSLGIAWSLEQTKYFIKGCKYHVIVTDHKPLVNIFCDRALNKIQNTLIFRLIQRTLLWGMLLSIFLTRILGTP